MAVIRQIQRKSWWFYWTMIPIDPKQCPVPYDFAMRHIQQPAHTILPRAGLIRYKEDLWWR